MGSTQGRGINDTPHMDNIEDKVHSKPEDLLTNEGLNPFDTVPVETFLYICSFLDPKFISHTLRFVCLRFHDILEDETYWKARVFATYKCGLYPGIPVDENEFNWREACTEIECQRGRWRNKVVSENTNLKSYQWKDIHYAAVDAVHLLNNASICVSGGRDRSIVVWDLSELGRSTASESPDYKPPFTLKAAAHLGWIWDFASVEDKLYSCSWDTYVSRWSLEQELQQDASYKCENAVLSVVVHDNILAAGMFNSKINLFDVRTKNVISSYKAHRRSVLDVCIDDRIIISGSEDQTLAIWDRRAGKIFKEKIKLYRKRDCSSNESFGKAFPMCLSYKYNQLYVGDSEGQLHLFYPSNGTLLHVERTSISSSSKINCIDQGYGHIIVGTAEASINILTPTKTPSVMCVLESGGGEVTDLAYQENVLATGGTDNSVQVWISSKE